MTDRPAVAVFGSSKTSPGSADWNDAEKVGRSLAQAGFAVVTGGYRGTMEAVSKGVAEAGGHVIGVTSPALFPDRPGANRYVAEEIQAVAVTSRIETMMDHAGGVMVLPGSIGTATELLVAWNVNHVARNSGKEPIPTVAVGSEWRTVAETLVTEVDAFPGDIHLADTIEQALTWLTGALRTRLD